MRTRREDVRELIADIAFIRGTDFQDGPDLDGTMRLVSTTLDTVVNVLTNLGDELEDLEARIKRLERAR
jgi:hypothetical protein